MNSNNCLLFFTLILQILYFILEKIMVKEATLAVRIGAVSIIEAEIYFHKVAVE